MKTTENKGLLLKIMLSSVGFAFLAFLFMLFQFFVPPEFSGHDVQVEIKQGSGTKAIARDLKAQGLIRNETAFYLLAKIKKFDKRLRAGTFTLSSSDSLASVLIQLQTQSGVSNLIRVTIPEGYDLRQIAQLIEDKGFYHKDDFLAYINTEAKQRFLKKYPFLIDASNVNFEGFIFPDTYYFAKGESLYRIVDAFLKQFETVIIPIWEAAETSQNSPKKRFDFYKVLTMASIIQKEARHEVEMPKISSVFYNRLKKMMPLGADPTVVYGLGLTTKQLVTYKDTDSTSPYNTYRVFGFPPTPIASPGKLAFEAAVKPIKTDYFFFVANKDGTHTFTRTYAEHLSVQRRK